MFLGIDHVAVAVPNIKEALVIFQKALGLPLAEIEEVADQKVNTAVLPLGDGKVSIQSRIELVEPAAEDSPISKFLAKRGSGIHHLALAVTNIEEAIEKCKKAGLQMIDEKPRPGAGQVRIAFIHPKSTAGVLLELCERKRK